MRPRAIACSFFALVIYALFPACGRHRLNSDEIARNKIYAGIIEREDRRDLGDGKFFETNLLSCPYPEARIWSAIAMGRIGNPKALPLLYKAMRSELAVVRAASTFAVGEIEDRDQLKAEHRLPDPEASSQLARMLDDSSLEVRGRAAEAIGKAGSGADAMKIARILENMGFEGSPGTRTFIGLAITALMRIQNPQSFPVLQKLTLVEDPEIQWQAANALVRAGDRTALPFFQRLLDSPLPDVRAYAARGIGICGDSTQASKLAALLPLLDSKTGRPIPLQVRVSAVTGLARLKDSASVPAICAAIGRVQETAPPDQINFAIQAAAALGTIGASEAEPTLAQLASQPGAVSYAALVALAKILKPTPERFFQIVKPGNFTSPSGMRAWVEALGELGSPEAQRQLKDVLIRSAEEHASRSDVMAVPGVLLALVKAGAPDLKEILKPYLRSHDNVVLRAAVAAYGAPQETSDPWVPIVEAYETARAGGDIETKVSILEHMRPWLGEKAIQATLALALNDPLRNARISAAALLRGAGADNVPDDPGPSETTVAGGIYELLAGSRTDRTVASLETSRGHVEIELFPEDAPLTVSNFISLARRGFYNGLSFMRVVPFFVVQSGDPRNDQEGGPGYSIRCEINEHPFERGRIGMALAGKDTGGSQFFITLSPQPHLDGAYTCFGRVISGMQVLDNLVPDDRINKVTIEDDVTAVDYRRY